MKNTTMQVGCLTQQVTHHDLVGQASKTHTVLEAKKLFGCPVNQRNTEVLHNMPLEMTDRLPTEATTFYMAEHGESGEILKYD